MAEGCQKIVIYGELMMQHDARSTTDIDHNLAQNEHFMLGRAKKIW